MKKRRLLKLFIVLLVIVVVVILSSTVFTLRNVELCFYDSNNNLIEDYEAGLKHFTEGDTQDIIDSGEFKMGKNIFLIRKQPSIDKIEAKFPYIKVIGISATFPDGFKIKARERVETYCITLASGQVAICDSELKILDIKDSVNKFDYIALRGLGLNDAKKGQFLTGENEIKVLKKLGSEFGANRYNNEASIKNFESVIIENKYMAGSPQSKSPNLIIQTRVYNADDSTMAGVKIEVENINANFESKLNKALSIDSKYLAEGSVKSRSGTIKIYDNLTGAYVDSTGNTSSN